jgi:uncharacterized protein
MRKIVFDTNVLISAFIVKNGIPAQILTHRAPFTIVTSEEILSELLEKLQLPRLRNKYSLTDTLIAGYLTSLREISSMVTVHTTVTIVRDPDDNKVLACAVDGKAEYVVTGDPDLLVIGTYQGITMLSPAQLLEVLQREYTQTG